MYPFREKYEADEQKNKEKDLKKRLAASQGKDALSAEEDDDGIATRRSGGRSRESDRRKEALKNLKSNKSSDKTRSMLSDRFGDDDHSDDDDGVSGRSRDLAEKRRKRQELQRGGSRGQDDDDDDSGSEERRPSKSSSGQAEASKGSRAEENEAEPKPEELVPVNWSQANHYLLRKRTFVEKYFFEPYFETLMRGIYVRLPIDRVDGEMIYRFCEVVNVCKLATPYTFMGESTRKGVLVAFGKSKREWKLSYISSHSLQEREFLVWRATLNKEGITLPTHAEAIKMKAAKERLIHKHRYTDEEVNEMVRRRKDIGVSTVSLGVQRVRLERDLKAAQDMKNFEKAVRLEEKLQKLLEQNEARQKKKSDDVLRINEINARNRIANQQQDLQAGKLNEVMLDKMTSAERLQFVRANGQKMFLSRDKLEKNLAEGKLIQMPDGRIMTVNKLYVVEALPDDLIPTKAGEDTNSSSGGNSMEIDIDRLLAKKREREQKETQRLEDKARREAQIEYVGAAPTSVQEIANSTIRIQDDDGTWTTLRPASEIVKEMQSKPVVSAEAKASRKGISLKDYFDRIKRRRVDE